MILNEKECNKAGIDAKKVAQLARKIERNVKEADKLGMQVFGGAWGGTLRYEDDPNKGALILASMNGNWDGGDGAYLEKGDGLLRGEHHND